MSKKSDQQAEIFGCFDGLSDVFPDKSTEFLLQMTADAMKCSYSDVVGALDAYARVVGDDVSAAKVSE